MSAQTWDDRWADSFAVFTDGLFDAGAGGSWALGSHNYQGEDDHGRSRRDVIATTVSRVVSDIERTLWDAEDLCESTIEVTMLHALIVAGSQFCDVVLNIGDMKRSLNIPFPSSGAPVLIIEPQGHVEDYRVDFLITETDAVSAGFLGQTFGCKIEPFSASVVVECDGHEFHEKTKAQASRDKKRDREIQKHGLPILHYTGADLWRDAIACADDATSMIAKINLSAVHRLRRSRGREK